MRKTYMPSMPGCIIELKWTGTRKIKIDTSEPLFFMGGQKKTIKSYQAFANRKCVKTITYESKNPTIIKDVTRQVCEYKSKRYKTAKAAIKDCERWSSNNKS